MKGEIRDQALERQYAWPSKITFARNRDYIKKSEKNFHALPI